MTELIARNFWWPWMGCYVADYMKGCNLCNCTKTFQCHPPVSLCPTECLIVVASYLSQSDHRTASEPRLRCHHGSGGWPVQMSSCHTNHIRRHSSRGSPIIPRPCMETPWSTGRSDQRPRDTICIQLHRSLSHLLGIRVAASTAYHPQIDSQTERVNQEVEQFLRLFVNQWQDDWYEWLAIAEFSYNDRIHAPHAHPHYDGYRQNPRLGIEPPRELRLKHSTTLPLDGSAMKGAPSALSQAADDMAHFYDAIGERPHCNTVGDKSGLMGRISLQLVR